MWHLQKFKGQPGCGPLLFSIFFFSNFSPPSECIFVVWLHLFHSWRHRRCSGEVLDERVSRSSRVLLAHDLSGTTLLSSQHPLCLLFNLVFIIVVHRMVCQHKLFSDWRLKPVIEFQRQMERRLSIRVLTETIWVCISACHAWLWGPGYSFLILIISAAKLRGGHL